MSEPEDVLAERIVNFDFDRDRRPPVVYAEGMNAKLHAEAAYFTAQTEGQIIDNQVAMALAESAKIALHREELKEAWDGAANGRHRVYHFVDDITPETVEPCIDVLSRWQRIDVGNETPWRFVITSSGGNVVAGIKLYSLLKAIATVRPLTTVASGMCASMACVVHQAGTERIIEPGCSYLLHDVSGQAGGSYTMMQDTMAWFKMINHRLHIALAEKAAISVEEIESICERRDAWYMAEEVVTMGLADKIGFAI